MSNTVLALGNCLELMDSIPDNSVDLVLADPPYGITKQNRWDSVIPFDAMWKQLNRITKDTTPILLFSQMPFGAELIHSNLKNFRYEWIYQKPNATGFLNANKMPLRAHENILVFYKRLPTYNPQKTKGEPYKAKSGERTSNNYGEFDGKWHTENKTGDRYPTDIIKFNKEQGYHPTQKPVPLLEYLIKTYSNFGDNVLDFCMGSGSTGVACVNTNRDFIGFEIEPEYYKIANKRIRNIDID